MTYDFPGMADLIGFDIDEIQAEYIAEIKLRNLNKEYILNRVSELDSLSREIEDLAEFVNSNARIKKHIAKQLMEIKKKHGIPRKHSLYMKSLLRFHPRKKSS